MKTKISLIIHYSLFTIHYFLFSIFFLLSVVFLLPSCKNKNHKHPVATDTPTSGELAISADESFAPVVNDEVASFEALYKEANIHINFKAEPDVVRDLLDNHVREIIISRKLKNEELSYFRSDYPPLQLLIGMDAVAFIVNKQNPDSNLLYEQVVDILSGKILEWKQINSTSSPGKISIIFDSNRSGMYRFLKEDVLKGSSITPQAFGVDSNVAVIKYVENDPSAIGVIGASYIINSGDTAAKSILNKISVVGISNPDSNKNFYRPFHKELMRKSYPFLRRLYIISTEEYAGLGTGFATYVASDEGQTVMQRSGLVPAKLPVRMIQLRNEF